MVWRLVGAAAILVFAGLAVTAIRVLVGADRWGIEASKSLRWIYVSSAATVLGVLIVVRIVASGANPDLPVKDLDARKGAVLVTALIAAIPWLALVWAALHTCQVLRRRIEHLPPIPTRPAEPSSDRPHVHREVIVQLLRLCDLLVLCVGAFVIRVVAAIIASSTPPHRLPRRTSGLCGRVSPRLTSCTTAPCSRSWPQS